MGRWIDRPLQHAITFAAVLCISSVGVAFDDKDNSPIPAASDQDDIPRERVVDPRVLEERFNRLQAGIDRSILEGKLNEALEASRTYAAELAEHEHESSWIRILAKAWNAELEIVARRSAAEQATYISAFRALSDGKKLLNSTQLDEAAARIASAIQKSRNAIGDDSILAATAMIELYYVKHLTSRFQEAKEMAIGAADAWEKLAGRGNPNHAQAIYAAGLSALELKRYEEAEPFFRNALEFQRKIFGVKHGRYATTLGQLAQSLIEQSITLEAEAICVQAICLLQELNLTETSQMAIDLYCMAQVQISHQELEIAEKNLSRSLKLCERVLPPGHESTKSVAIRYSQLLRTKGAINQADAVEKRFNLANTEANQ